MDEPAVTSGPARPQGAESAEAEALLKLNDLSSSLSCTPELKEGLLEVLVAVIGLLGADKGNVQLLDAERGVLTIEVQKGFEQNFLDSFKQVSTVDDSACGRALRLRRPVIIEDTETDAGYARFRAAARAAGYRAVISSPIMGSDALPLGMISVHFASPHQPTEREMRLLTLYVRQAADFIQRCTASTAGCDKNLFRRLNASVET
jgi:GAF domain-containing protein